ncbi:hypothetical protein BD309DRAFT_973816 [Dichomitus squalens]|nr:hypothetical protein BD309DRAFT_973816 [Dichomitus squalens]
MQFLFPLSVSSSISLSISSPSYLGHNLPTNNLQTFLASALNISLPICSELWTLLRDVLWLSLPSSKSLSGRVVESLIQFGVRHGIGVYNLYPPTRNCLRTGCKYLRRHAGDQRVLEQPITTNAVYFSREHGPVPAVSHSLRCPQCHARYYPNYWIDSAGDSRTYYEGPTPTAIHVTTHVFIDDNVTANELCHQINKDKAYW